MSKKNNPKPPSMSAAHYPVAASTSWRCLALLSAIALCAAVASPCAASASAPADAFTLEVPLDLPPLPRHVASWSVDDVERWLNITIGYPEYAPAVRMHLIDGPTLLTIADMRDAFPSAPAVHVAKLTAHQQLLRGQCLCARGSTDRNIWTYFRYSTASTAFHLTMTVFAPRIGFASAYLFDRPLLCCAVGGGGGGGDADSHVAQELFDQHVGRAASGAVGGAVVAESPCGASASACAAAPSVLVTLLSLLVPYAVLVYNSFAALSAHPIAATLWAVAFLGMQLTELLQVAGYVAAWRDGDAVPLRDIAKSALLSFVSPVVALVPAALVIGWLVPGGWVAYSVLAAVSAVNVAFVARFLFNFIGAFFHSATGSDESGEQQQQQHRDR